MVKHPSFIECVRVCVFHNDFQIPSLSLSLPVILAPSAPSHHGAAVDDFETLRFHISGKEAE